jgi:hypothetical protein
MSPWSLKLYMIFQMRSVGISPNANQDIPCYPQMSNVKHLLKLAAGLMEAFFRPIRQPYGDIRYLTLSASTLGSIIFQLTRPQRGIFRLSGPVGIFGSAEDPCLTGTTVGPLTRLHVLFLERQQPTLGLPCLIDLLSLHTYKEWTWV